MKIASWNVNGIRAIAKKGFWQWFEDLDADIICLQETKAFPAQLEGELRCPMGYHAVWHAGKTPGYAGTVIFSKQKPLSQQALFHDLDAFHEDGRVVEARFEQFVLLNIYFPNGSPRADGREMLNYKLDFYRRFLAYVNKLRAEGLKVIACGDYNICHREIDIARPKENANSIGFLPIERAELDKIVAAGYVDVFRYFYPDQGDAYTWWSYRGGARQRNVGWRIDYFFVSDDLLPSLSKFWHQDGVQGSDHCPLVLELNFD
jgi:exodeoxyribonuclease-3